MDYNEVSEPYNEMCRNFMVSDIRRGIDVDFRTRLTASLRA